MTRLDGLRIVAAYLDSAEAMKEKPRAVEGMLKENTANPSARSTPLHPAATASRGIQFLIRNPLNLDAASRRVLDRFL